jgi:lipoprotein-releasing system ATP-binding protein
MNNLISSKNLKKWYYDGPSKLEVLHNINLDINKGEFISIIGPSGAGKSTLIHLLGGLDTPSEGAIFFKDKNLSRLNDRKKSLLRNKNVGFVFQFYNLLPGFSALENVMLPGLIKTTLWNFTGRKKIKIRAKKLLEDMGLGQRLAHKPNQLSGGEQQRVAFARALINSPEIIFADEPTGNLDEENSNIIIKLLKDLHQKNNCTLITVTHNENIAGKANRIVRLKDGKIVSS